MQSQKSKQSKKQKRRHGDRGTSSGSSTTSTSSSSSSTSSSGSSTGTNGARTSTNTSTSTGTHASRRRRNRNAKTRRLNDDSTVSTATATTSSAGTSRNITTTTTTTITTRRNDSATTATTNMDWLDDSSDDGSGSDWLADFSASVQVAAPPMTEEQEREGTSGEEETTDDILFPSTTTSSSAPAVIRDIPGYYFDAGTSKYYRDTPEMRARSRRKADAIRKPKRVQRKMGVASLTLPVSIHRSLCNRESGGVSRRDRRGNRSSEVLQDALPSHLSAAYSLAPTLSTKETFGLHYEALEEAAGCLTVAGTTTRGSSFSATYGVAQRSPNTRWRLKEKFVTNLLAERVTGIERKTQNVDKSFIFESVLGGGGAAGYLQVSTEGSEGESDGFRIRERVTTHALREGSMWCFALHPRIFTGTPLVGLGGTKKAYVFDLATSTRKIYNTNDSDVLHQQFNGDLLISGLRDGRVRYHDVRVRNESTGVVMYDTKSSVCWTRLLSGGQDLLVCSMDGSIQIFDIRRETRRKQHFDGHSNSHTVLRGCVDDQERFLFAGGQDGIVRAWSLRTSHLLMANESLITQGGGIPRVLSWLPEGPSLIIGTENGAFAMDVAGSVNK